MADPTWADRSLLTLMAIINGRYFNILAKDCPTCASKKQKRSSSPSSSKTTDSQKMCHNFFCLDCKEGGVCRETFKDGGDHANHSCLQVRKVTRENALLVEDLLGNSSTKPLVTEEHSAQIQRYRANDKPHIKFERQSVSSKAPLFTRLQICAACKLPISGSGYANQSTSPVCSMKCFLDHVMTQRVNDLLLPAIACSNMARDWDDLIGENGAGKGN